MNKTAEQMKLSGFSERRIYRLVGRGFGTGELCVRLNNWKGKGPHNCLVLAACSGFLVVPHRRIRRAS